MKFLRNIFMSKTKREIETLKTRISSLESQVVSINIISDLKCGGSNIDRNGKFDKNNNYWANK